MRVEDLGLEMLEEGPLKDYTVVAEVQDAVTGDFDYIKIASVRWEHNEKRAVLEFGSIDG